MLSKATQQWLERATDKERPFMEDAAFIFGGWAATVADPRGRKRVDSVAAD
jgi:hypothetical protein